MKFTIINGTCEHMDEVQDESIGLVVTSPPYFNAKDYGDTGESNIGNNQELQAYNQYLKLMETVYRECYKKLKYGGHMVVNVADVICDERKYAVSMDTGVLLHKIFNGGYLDTILWKKPDGMSSQKRFGIFIQNPYPKYFRPNNMYEPCFVFIKGKKDYNFDKESNKLNWELFKKYQTDVWEMQPETSISSLHPAPFPLELPLTFIKLLTVKGEIVLEPFLGSGTTMIAARQCDRECIGYELNADYIEKAIKQRLGVKQGMKHPEGIQDFAGNIYVFRQQGTMPKVASDGLSTSFSTDVTPVCDPIAEGNLKNEVVQDWHTLFGGKTNGTKDIKSENKETKTEVGGTTNQVPGDRLVPGKLRIYEEPKPAENIVATKLEELKEQEIDDFERTAYGYICRDCFSTFYVIKNICYAGRTPDNKICIFDRNCPYCHGHIQHTQDYIVDEKWKKEVVIN